MYNSIIIIMIIMDYIYLSIILYKKKKIGVKNCN